MQIFIHSFFSKHNSNDYKCLWICIQVKSCFWVDIILKRHSTFAICQSGSSCLHFPTKPYQHRNRNITEPLVYSPFTNVCLPCHIQHPRLIYPFLSVKNKSLSL